MKFYTLLNFCSWLLLFQSIFSFPFKMMLFSCQKRRFHKKHCINFHSKIMFTDHSKCSQQGSVCCNPPLSLNSLSEKTTLFKHVTTKQLEDIPQTPCAPTKQFPLKSIPRRRMVFFDHVPKASLSIPSREGGRSFSPFHAAGGGGGNPKITFSCRPTSRNRE